MIIPPRSTPLSFITRRETLLKQRYNFVIPGNFASRGLPKCKIKCKSKFIHFFFESSQNPTSNNRPTFKSFVSLVAIVIGEIYLVEYFITGTYNDSFSYFVTTLFDVIKTNQRCSSTFSEQFSKTKKNVRQFIAFNY